MIKCIVCDLDGTLLNKDHVLGEFNASVIRQVQAAGLEFMIATGRSWDSVEPLLAPYGVTCRCLLLNGAIVQDRSGKIIKEIPLDEARIKHIIEILERFDVNIQLYTKDGVATPHPERIKDDFKKRIMKMEQKSEQEVEEMMSQNGFFNFQVVIDSWEAYFASNPVVYKMEAFSNDDEKMIQVRHELKDIPNIDISDSIGKNFELTDVRAQKGIVLASYIKELGYEMDEVAVFGDSMNDYLMMKNFPHSYAPKNACETILELSSKVIGYHYEDAVGKEILDILQVGNKS